jgi:hypothetical protein
MRRWSGRAAVVAALFLTLAGRAGAHVGPPIIENRLAGPYVITVWAHPDLGTGAFYVILEPAPGTTLPEENEVRVSVQPLSERLPEASYTATRQDVTERVQYYAEAEFDRQELWRVRVQVSGAAGSGEVVSEVEPTPTTYGRWDLLIYACPFVLFGSLFLYAALRRRLRRARGGAPAPRAGAAGAPPHEGENSGPRHGRAVLGPPFAQGPP